jgi:hypothetical protein
VLEKMARRNGATSLSQKVENSWTKKSPSNLLIGERTLSTKYIPRYQHTTFSPKMALEYIKGLENQA